MLSLSKENAFEWSLNPDIWYHYEFNVSSSNYQNNAICGMWIKASITTSPWKQATCTWGDPLAIRPSIRCYVIALRNCCDRSISDTSGKVSSVMESVKLNCLDRINTSQIFNKKSSWSSKKKVHTGTIILSVTSVQYTKELYIRLWVGLYELEEMPSINKNNNLNSNDICLSNYVWRQWLSHR